MDDTNNFWIVCCIFSVGNQEQTSPRFCLMRAMPLYRVRDNPRLFLTIFEVCNHSGDREGMRAGYIAAFILMAGVWLVFWVAGIFRQTMDKSRNHFNHKVVSGWYFTGDVCISCRNIKAINNTVH